MGSKSSHFMQADRPESGGSNRKDIKDKTGQHEHDKQKVDSHWSQEKAEENLIPRRGENPELEQLRERKAQGESAQAAEQVGLEGE